MFEPLLASPQALLTGALTGLVFGFLLQKAHVTRADTILGQFLLRDFTVLKVMLSAVIVGGLGIYALLQLGWIEGLQVKTAYLAANAAGGVIFGVGMAVLGYCPGTGVAALGDGSRDALAGLLGMLIGAGLYAEAHPWVAAHVLGLSDLGKMTLVTATGASPFWLLALMAALAALGFGALERFERRRGAAALGRT